MLGEAFFLLLLSEMDLGWAGLAEAGLAVGWLVGLAGVSSRTF